MINFFIIFLGGGLGSVLRYLVSIYCIRFSFPIGTLLSNIFSCLLLGVSIFLLEKYSLSHSMRLLFVVGFCGGLSTFSTFSYETVHLLKLGHIYYAIFNVLFNIILCFSVLYFVMKKL